jgi:PadR family transcriptional regulator, regulatory protein PadR
MAKDSTGCLQGSLDLLILRSLESRGRMHGYGITVHIQSRSENALRIEEGSLYPALHRMDQAGWVKADWAPSENNRRARYYTITPAGRKQLAAEQDKWMEVAGAVARFLRYA